MQKPAPSGPMQPDQTVILLAEDDLAVQNIVRVVLEAEGYLVLTAQDGQEALQLSRSYPGEIHLLLTDVRMPGMGGLELRDKILQERPVIEVVVMSGECDPCGEVAFLPKPFTVEDLRRTVNAAAGGPVLFPA